MSSTISTTEVQTLAPGAVTKLKSEEKPHKLVRSSSIEKIRRFNTFICSQQYYFLPAIFNWLKSSQSLTERTIFLFRATLFNAFFYRFFQTGLRSAALGRRISEKRVDGAALISNFFTKCFESTHLLTVAVYSACSLVVFQLVLAIYLMCFALLPYGFFFLLSCMMVIKYLCYKNFVCTTARLRGDIRNK